MGRILVPAAVAGDTHETYRREGERNVGLRIMATLKSGQRIGTVQDRAAASAGMKNHVHVQVHDRRGEAVDSAPWLEKWGVK